MRARSNDPFVGRERELDRLDALFAGASRLVSIVGGPGVGKSRLAVQWASERASSVIGAQIVVLRVDLAGTCTEEEIAVAFAHALRLRDSSPAFGHVDARDLMERVEGALEVGELDLVLLDDAERAVPALATPLARWLELASSTRFLISSRQAVLLRSEQVLELEPLSLPEGSAADEVARSEAAQLLLARSDRIALDDESAEVIARLVRRLDGNPLAIELAAARLRSLGLRDLADRIGAGLDLLDRAPRDAGLRHGSLRGAIDVSWQLSSDAERALLRLCSVFPGSFDVDAVEAVTAGLLADSLGALHGARERSLVSMRELSGRSRYALSAPVRAFAEEMLEASGEAIDARARHAAWLADRAGRASERWRVSALDLDLAFLREHQADLGVALAHAGDDVLRARLLLAFDVVLRERERPDAHVALLRRLRREALAPGLDVELAIALALALERAGEARAGIEELAAGRERARGDRAAELEVTLAQLSQSCGALDAAHDALTRALELAPPRSPIRVRALRGLGLVAHARGDLDRAEAHYQSALALSSELPLLDARLSSDLGSVRLQQRRLDEAREHFERALACSRQAPDPVTIGLTEGNLAILAQEEGHLDDAAAAFARAVEQLAQSGHLLYEAHLTLYAGFVEHERGDLRRAIERYGRAIRTLEAIGDARMAGLGYAGLGAAEAERGRLAAAHDALARSEHHLAGIGDEGLALALSLHRAHVALSEADVDSSRATALREGVAAIVASADPVLLGRSDDARTARRILTRRLRARSLVLARDASEARLGDGTRIELARRDVLRRIVIALARARVEAPDRAVTIERLIEEGWPGERMRWESALNRFKVALSTLRKLGFKELIVRRDDGYLLDPAVPIHWVDDEP